MKTRDAVIIAGGMLSQQASQFVVAILIGRSLGAGDYGVFSLLRNGTLWLLPILSLGLELSIQKRVANETVHGEFRPIYRLLRITVLLLNIAVIGCVEVASYGIKMTPSFDWYLLLAFLAMPFVADATLAMGYLRALSKSTLVSICNDYAQSLLRLVLVLIACAVTTSLSVILGINIFVAAVAALALWLLQIYVDRKRNAVHVKANYVDGSPVKTVLSITNESIWIAFSILTYGTLRVSDLFVLGYFAAPAALGAYAALSNVATFVRLYPLALSQPLAAHVSRAFHQGDFDTLRNLLMQNTKQSVVVGAFVFAGIAAFGRYLNFVFGESFVFEPLICFLLPFSWLVSSVLTPMGLALSMTNNHRKETILLFGGAIGMIVLLLILTPHFGIYGAASASTISFCAINVIRLILAQRVLKRSLWSNSLLLPVIFSLATAYPVEIVASHLVTMTFFTVACASIVYTLLYWGGIFLGRKLLRG